MINASLTRNKVSKEQIASLAKQLMGGGAPEEEMQEPPMTEDTEPIAEEAGDPSAVAKRMMGVK